MADRVEVLKTLLADDPKNTFARYGLAMEYMRAGQLDTAVSEFRSLIDIDANYCAAYFHGGQTLEKMGDVDEAKKMYEAGVEATVRTGDGHTRSELEAAISMLPL